MEFAVELQNVTRRFKKMTAVDNLSFLFNQASFWPVGPKWRWKNYYNQSDYWNAAAWRGISLSRDLTYKTQAQQVRRSIGLVPRKPMFMVIWIPWTIWHHAALYCDDLSDIPARIEELLRLMELTRERRKDPVRTFRVAWKRRLALARAMLHEPKIILFDEPTTGGWCALAAIPIEHIKDLQSQGIPFLISSNDRSEVDALCDRLVIIDHGKAITLDTLKPWKLLSSMTSSPVPTDTSSQPLKSYLPV